MSFSYQLPCPDCGTINRIAHDKPAQAAKCGRCKAGLFQGRPIVLDGAGLRRHLEHGQLPLLVDFWAAWCGPCRAMAPVFEEAARTLEPALRLAKIDTEREPELSRQLGIRSIPTLVLFRDGGEAARLSGAVALADLLSWVRENA